MNITTASYDGFLIGWEGDLEEGSLEMMRLKYATAVGVGCVKVCALDNATGRWLLVAGEDETIRLAAGS